MTCDAIVREVGPRDGLQLVKTVLPTETKLAWIRADVAAGIPEVEVCSFVPPSVIAQFADAKDVASAAARIPGFTPSVLVPNLKGAERAFVSGVPKINYVLSVSETHNRENVRRTRAESLEGLRAIIARRDEAYPNVQIGVGLATALGCALEGAIPVSETLLVLEQVLDIRVDEVALPDTVGYAHPSQVRSLFIQAIRLCGKVPVWSHFHDTRGLGLANVYAALEAGCRRFDASMAGLGGCPFAPGATGNIALEDLVFLLEAEGLKTGIDIAALAEARAIVEAALPGERMHGLVLKAGLPKGFVQASTIAAE